MGIVKFLLRPLTNFLASKGRKKERTVLSRFYREYGFSAEKYLSAVNSVYSYLHEPNFEISDVEISDFDNLNNPNLYEAAMSSIRSMGTVQNILLRLTIPQQWDIAEIFLIQCSSTSLERFKNLKLIKQEEKKAKEAITIALSPLGSDWAEQTSKGVKLQVEIEKNEIEKLIKQSR